MFATGGATTELRLRATPLPALTTVVGLLLLTFGIDIKPVGSVPRKVKTENNLRKEH